MTSTDIIESSSVPAGCLRCDASLQEVSLFLADYAAWLHGAGATCIRLERNVSRMAEALGCEAVMTILPRHIHLTTYTMGCSESYTYIAATRQMPISFDINTKLSSLSWKLADGRIDFKEARRKFETITGTPAERPQLVLLLASLANASFCRDRKSVV